MPRAKRGPKRVEKRKKLEKLSKGYRGTKSKLYRSMRESVQRALKFAYVGRKVKKRDFRSLWIANAFAQAAAWGLIVTRGWLIYDQTESSFLVGVATFAALGPQFIVPPIVGVLADRMDRRTILSWTYGVNSIQNGLLAVLALTGALEIWMLIALSVVNGVARSAQMPTAQAMSASLVPREKLLNALSLQASTQHGSRLIGPGLVTPLLALAGAPAGFFV